eukprot:gnl/Dysnectes_brevis/3583_a4557_1143.p1 GENE.gnl/Dysnectes_brevis/3583_a4557_1143~~gnl/Dysnectes_brevis/3583_a4557_1143.p1  ORF type:complete len:137 (+),score=13.26 gnl/Dysnectes_brevis/3583_a4557_1143:3-413(+)
MIYSFYIYRKNGKKIFGRSYKASPDVKDNSSMLAGLLYSLTKVAVQLSPKPEIDVFQSFSSDKYKCHFFSTFTGFWFVLLTDPSTQFMKKELEHIYGDLFVPYVTMNPMWTVCSPCDHSKLFTEGLDSYLQGCTQF